MMNFNLQDAPWFHIGALLVTMWALTTCMVASWYQDRQTFRQLGRLAGLTLLALVLSFSLTTLLLYALVWLAWQLPFSEQGRGAAVCGVLFAVIAVHAYRNKLGIFAPDQKAS